MKTKSTFKHIYDYILFILLLLGASLSLMAQCPTIADPNPPPICNVSGFTFSDLNAYATDTGNGIVWYNMTSGGSPFNGSQLVQEGIYYADDNSGTCGVRASINVSFQISPSGENLDRIYCTNENATIQTYIDDVLQSSIPSGGSVDVYYDFSLTSQASTSDTIPVGATNLYIVFVDSGGCESQIEVGQVGVFMAPANPTPTSPQMFCSTASPTLFDLDTGSTATNINWYANVDGSGDPILPALSLSTPLVNGNTYYIQVDDIFCVSNAIPVVVNIDVPVDPGTSASLDYCNDSLPVADFDLFAELGGTPDTTGTWSGPLTTINGYQGTVNITSLTTAGAYVFTYTVPSNSMCPDGVSNVTINVYEILTSGMANGPASYCESGLPSSFDLTTLLENEDPNGQWTQGTSSSDPVVISPVDLSAFTPGVYDFTYTQNLTPNPCPEESTTVQVIVLADPSAGVAVNQSFCENDLASNSPFDLFNALDGSQDNNSGTWTDASNSTISNLLDISGLTVAGSPYLFNYTIDNGTCSDTEQISITVEDAPESGAPVATFPEYCEGTAPTSFDLFDLLEDEDQTGTWYIGTDNTGSIITNPTDLSTFIAGTYDFTFDVDAIGSCDDTLVTVQVIILPIPITGTPSSATFCENDVTNNSPLDLFGQLTGEDPGGTWTDDNASGALSGSNVDLTILANGSYNYTYTITNTNNCTSSSTVAVNILPAPESGIANAPVEFCASDITSGQTFDLFDLLTGEDQSGVWSDDDASGALSGNLVSLEALSAGAYNFTFDVNAIGSCDDVNVTVSITINDTPPPPAPPSQAFCETGTVGELTATGTILQWYEDATGGSALTGTDTLTDGENYYVTQTDATTGCESSTRTMVTVTINPQPNAGNPNTTPITACNNNNSVSLATGLDGTQDAGGTWLDDDTTGGVSGGTFDASTVSAGTYNFTYVVTGIAPCADDSTTITITVEESLNPGTSTSINLCATDSAVDLFPLLGGADTGGIWSPALTSGTGVFDPATDPVGVYAYTLDNSCGPTSANVTVSLTQPANAGTSTTADICIDDAPTDLFTLLGTADNGGTWSPALASGTGVFDPSVDTAGVYTYSVSATAPCTTDASADVTVTVYDVPSLTVIDPNPEFCMMDNPTVADLDSSVQASGNINWYDDAALTTLLSTTDALVDGEDYFGTQSNSVGCESPLSIQIDVTVHDSPTPTLIDPLIDYCINDGPTINDLSQNIVEYIDSADNVIWYDAASGGSVISNGTLLTDTTYYAVLIDPATGCESAVRLMLTPDLTACGELVIPDGFSPNGDGVNDTFDMDNVGFLYPNFEIEIYNRNGNIVYKGDANTPRFDGTANQSRVALKGELPVGVYFYIFRFNDNINAPVQGRLYLNR